VSSKDIELMKEIEHMIKRIGDKDLRKKVKDLMSSPEVRFTPEYMAFEECPGGAYHHHSYQGGLLHHTVSVTRISLLLCDLIEGIYGGKVDRDTVLAGALLHDIMKCYVYKGNGRRFSSSRLGERIDHMTLLIAEMYKHDFPLDVIHTVVAHHGDNSPLSPRTLEALIVYMADYTDAELNRRVQRAAEGLARGVGIDLKVSLSAQEYLSLLKAKELEGWDAVRRLLSGILERKSDLTEP